ncbi:hypothetical protein [Tropicibacter oceani]|uniref:Uncharacterized protein n=1 Tax=Tropicibacter oceani TaxID=3058420 RepID=A0ABY8QEN8_9RHOB|nr:hypothetical protein [Tropicibacter oceani]WGW02908.1 hypothetical protein QF118_13295 [Tropicibacter oceani]
MTKAGSGWLLAPMELSALVVGVDAGSGTHAWNDLSPDFSRIYNDLAHSGPQLVRLFPQGGTTPAPGGGIHLHWLLPQAFGHGTQSGDGRLVHPHIPNRWLVRRIRHAPGRQAIVDIASWMIESDFLHDFAQTQRLEGAANFLHEPSPQLFANVGQATRLDKWTETQADYRLTLTALGSGSADFAASYPASRGVLGFHDADPSEGDDGDWQVSYQVIGWCSDPARDLLAGASDTDLAARLDALDFEISDTAKALGPMNRVLCHGAATRVGWNKADLHVSSVPSGAATVCVGNSSGEALASMLAPMMTGTSGDPATLEPILTAFHYDMLGSDHSLEDVGAELHRHRFNSRAGPDRFSIDARRNPVSALAASGAPEAVQPPRPVETLPPEIARALHGLNEQARAAFDATVALARARQDLFTLWCQWAARFYASRAEPLDLGLQILRARELVDLAAQQASGAADDLARQRSALEQTLAQRLPDLELAQSTTDPFYHPADPAVLITGKGFAPRNVYTQYSHPDKLPCRHGGELIDGVSALLPNQSSRATVRLQQLFPLTGMTALPDLATGPYRDLADGLLRETLLLDPVDPRNAAPQQPASIAPLVDAFVAQSSSVPSTAALKQLGDDIAALLSGTPRPGDDAPRFSALTPAAPARPPAQPGLRRWQGNPWRPVSLTWQIAWQPQSGAGGNGDLASGWTSWGLDSGGDDFTLPDTLTFDPEPSIYEGHAMLAPNAGWVLRRRLEKLIEHKANDRLSDIVSAIDDLPALGQTLSGFHEALVQLLPGLQLPPINPAYVLGGAGAKPDAVGRDIGDVAALDPQAMHAPDLGDGGAPRTAFQPIRAGLMKLHRLAVVDSFGQMRVVIDPAGASAPVVASFGLPQTAQARADNAIILPPRHVQPARLDFRWLPAQPGTPGGSPLCGWVFSNHLDQSLMVCDARGQLLGAVQRVIRAPGAGGGTAGAGFFWVPVPGSDNGPETIADPELRRFVAGLLRLGPDAGEDFLSALAAAQAQGESAVHHDARLSVLVGQPLALARAELTIQLEGAPLRSIAAPLPDADFPAPTRGAQDVAFPLQLGGGALAAGGLAGFLLAGDDTFYPRHGLRGRDFPGALVHGKQVPLSAGTPLPVTLLMDPHAPVYARTGVLPRHGLTLPEEVAAGLSAIRDVFFQSAPVLGPPGAPRVPSPSDDYGQWSWAVRPQVTHWKEYADISDPGDRGGFGPAPQELQEGWLKLVMNPVNIAAFWVKQGALKVPAGTRVTLGWMVEGAQTLTLSAEGTPDPIAQWTATQDDPLPQDAPYVVTAAVKLVLTATDASGNRSTRPLRFDVE